MTLPKFPPGVLYKMLSIDKDTGACTMTVQFNAGYKQFPSICRSDLELLVMEGSLEIGGKHCPPGHYRFVPTGVSMPALTTAQGCLALVMYNQAEPNLVESDRDADGADGKYLASVNSYDDLVWQVPTLVPAPEPGCMLKILHFDEATHAMSFLYNMTPGFWQDNISYHDCSEEAYHIWGTSWIMQFGHLPTGGYFFRPPYINHGAFASEQGVLAFGRTDSELYNHFHFHAHSTPSQNQERAAANLKQRKPLLYEWVKQHGHNHPTGW
jgi:hypothetical protein